MSNDFQAHYQALHEWALKAQQDGWITQSDVDNLKEIEQQQMSSLFSEHSHRPLIVGLFGGTGVGKSSLLNRLAGEDIARVGVERPTSHEVTLYLHQDFQIDLLPEELPLDQSRIAYHNKPERRLVAWLDMPDIDSTEQHNRALAEAWLPYLDWLIYVVSPERYHDDIGWRFLQQRSHRHAWLFVINHWDQGVPEQVEDFRKKLQQEGFSAPVILRTSCLSDADEDDFKQLEQTINNAIDNHGIDLLQQLGIQARIDDLQQYNQRFQQRIGAEVDWKTAGNAWRSEINQQLNAIEAPMRHHAQALTQQLNKQTAPSLTLSLYKRLPLPNDENNRRDDNPPIDAATLTQTLWSHRVDTSLNDLHLALINQLQASELPTSPIAQKLKSIDQQLTPRIRQMIDDNLNSHLATPGTPLQRGSYQLLSWLGWLLPLAAAIWAVFHVVGDFYTSTQGDSEFLGLNFAIHSGLLIGLAWLIPWFLQRKCKPSVATAARNGLMQGISSGKNVLKDRYAQIWRETGDERIRQRRQLLQQQQQLENIQPELMKALGGFIKQR